MVQISGYLRKLSLFNKWHTLSTCFSDIQPAGSHRLSRMVFIFTLTNVDILVSQFGGRLPLLVLSYETARKGLCTASACAVFLDKP